MVFSCHHPKGTKMLKFRSNFQDSLNPASNFQQNEGSASHFLLHYHSFPGERSVFGVKVK